MGLWSEATAHSQMAVSLARDADLVWQFALVHAVAAFPLAAQGQWKTAEDHVAGAQEAAMPGRSSNAAGASRPPAA